MEETRVLNLQDVNPYIDNLEKEQYSHVSFVGQSPNE